MYIIDLFLLDLIYILTSDHNIINLYILITPIAILKINRYAVFSITIIIVTASMR